MKLISCYESATGNIYKTQKEAEREIEKAYGAILTKISSEMVHLDGKYTSIVSFIDANLERFVNLAQIKEDLRVTIPEAY